MGHKHRRTESFWSRKQDLRPHIRRSLCRFRLQSLNTKPLSSVTTIQSNITYAYPIPSSCRCYLTVRFSVHGQPQDMSTRVSAFTITNNTPGNVNIVHGSSTDTISTGSSKEYSLQGVYKVTTVESSENVFFTVTLDTNSNISTTAGTVDGSFNLAVVLG